MATVLEAAAEVAAVTVLAPVLLTLALILASVTPAGGHSAAALAARGPELAALKYAGCQARSRHAHGGNQFEVADRVGRTVFHTFATAEELFETVLSHMLDRYSVDEAQGEE